jgi:hypothetical protein
MRPRPQPAFRLAGGVSFGGSGRPFHAGHYSNSALPASTSAPAAYFSQTTEIFFKKNFPPLGTFFQPPTHWFVQAAEHAATENKKTHSANWQPEHQNLFFQTFQIF